MRTLSLAALVGLAACSTLSVHTDYDPAAPFHNYRTYSWHDDAPVANQLLDRRIVAAVDKELTAKGLKRVDSGGDVFATYHGAVDKRMDISTVGYGYGGWYGPYGGVSSTHTSVNEIPTGTLIVDLVDAKSNQMVWRGTAEDDLRSSSSPEQAQQRVDDAVKEMFHKFPPGKNG
jgi:hypothetical protein